MNEQKHTPGPWMLRLARWTTSSPATGFSVNAKGKEMPIASAGCSVPDKVLVLNAPWADEGFYTQEEMEANALLIAAAPDLLTALLNTFCVGCERPIGQSSYENSVRVMCGQCIDARAAIKKATEVLNERNEELADKLDAELHTCAGLTSDGRHCENQVSKAGLLCLVHERPFWPVRKAEGL